MEKPFVIGIYGHSNSGKTNLIVDLIKYFRSKDFKVSSVKISSKKDRFDGPKKDSFRHTKAGSDLVVLASSLETVFLYDKKQDISEIIEKISSFDVFDIVFVEGANDKKTPKIRLGEIDERENTIHTYFGDFLRLVNIITEEMNKRIDKDE